ncbi:putative serine/threonine-protein kinase isoform X2 [Beta vulgaris subsp. vulgaris]|uniref:putative serine/threonine-protein kinase isoform X2 n=1 Tax=Beta vulgaris subsp. vulgaris TaxID=3555 RepID=UPI002037089E|nr:putative serine/threonine-protein kinase isoform X2 [Beta vulgaris subsp. vulgaris]
MSILKILLAVSISGWAIALITIVGLCVLFYVHFRLRKKHHVGDVATTITTATTVAGPVAQGEVIDPDIEAHNIFGFDELLQATNGFSRDRLIGEGGFGLVYQAVLEDGREVAIKRLREGSRQIEQFATEMKLKNHLAHNSIVRNFGCCIEGRERCIVYSLAHEGSLESHIKDLPRKKELNWKRRYEIALGVASAIQFLHTGESGHVIIHRDIKSSNILLDHQFKPKLADFGIAKMSEEEFTHLTTEAKGTIGYMDPSYSQTGKLTMESDVFSFGVVLLELITGINPTDNKSLPVGVAMVHWATQLIKQGLEDENFKDLVDKRLEQYDVQQLREMTTCAALCVRKNPTDRPKMSEIVQVLEGNIPAREIAGASGIWSEEEDNARELWSMAFEGQSSQVQLV